MQPYQIKKQIPFKQGWFTNAFCSTPEYSEERAKHMKGINMTIQYSMVLNSDCFRKTHIFLMKTPHYKEQVKVKCKKLAEKMETFDDYILNSVDDMNRVDEISESVRKNCEGIFNELIEECRKYYTENTEILARVEAYNLLALILGKQEMEMEADVTAKYRTKHKMGVFSSIDTAKHAEAITNEVHKRLHTQRCKVSNDVLNEIDKRLDHTIYQTLVDAYTPVQV